MDILFYISLPIFYLVHDAEEMLRRKKWEEKHYNDIVTKYPKSEPYLRTLKGLTQLEYGIVIFEQLIFLVISVVLAIYADMVPLFSLFWGFGLHLIVHIVHSIGLRIYMPGLISSIALLPYFGIGIYDLMNRFSPIDNLIMALCGFFVIFLNLILMYMLMKKFSDL